ncbi:molybdopterin-dependent oxidoreductase [Blautia schinkii]|uniref:xanthine dehydrogenase family protein molybdopterin-binding subunit n=1 Tax=Blautia schinkii TaxID=180164 RepID=UPI00156E4AEE|nr:MULTISPECIES: molybdopterin cofactor-binding domain-containing protein [Clostridia]NSG81157.1 molybdopterin-dependent oxidoreductase [Blautia schinkii]NSK21756.1 molybdopterin-dependent oxidoreductase [Blautia schinkii]NSK24799.1 molybdopterin-dependent oxidoreductase [Blautia schinkii]NSK31387.1 molybdopterin-dependent oxidoreductase [Blautia schinkii]NSK36614.1 molybdopterin-dependent oxidoreductase [Blautia schinkii]
MKYVNMPVPKTDAMSLVTGKPVYTDDLAPSDCLIVKLLRSPHANAWVEEIKTDAAKKIEGIECVLTYEDVSHKRFTLAGQTAPEISPWDRYIIDKHVRFVGDTVAIVAGETEEAVDKALKRIKVKYRVEDAVLDIHTAKDNPILVHPEEDWYMPIPAGGDNRRNLCSSNVEEVGDVDAMLEKCAYTVDQVYHTKANQQTMMETFRTYCYMDHFQRLTVVSSTQIPFHVRRIVGNALNIPSSKVRVIKPRIGGGFGAKQTSVSEVYPALVTWVTGKPSKIVFSRKESMIASSPRHEMEVHIRMGADENGIVKAIDLYTLSNTGAYGEHGPTTVGLSGHKSIALYRHTEAYRFAYDVVYTNMQAAGAYRGYGATQGIFAVESAADELAHKMGMDPVKFRELNMPMEGEALPGYPDVPINGSCTMDKCLARAKEMIGWDEKYPFRDMGNGKVRGVGIAMAMQGSSIAGLDVGGADIKLNEDGSYTLALGCSDMGTGCDTILAQMAADCLDTDMKNIVVFSVDTDISPYDSGSYASSTTYATGNAVMQACAELRKRIHSFGAQMLEVSVEESDFDGTAVRTEDGKEVTLRQIALKATAGICSELQVVKEYSSPISPPPFMVGAAEVEIDKETGQIDVIDYVGVIDCGTPINPNLARVQAEGGIGQGIGMVLYEDVQYTEKGKIRNNSFMQYKIPNRMDIPSVRIEFESSYEKTGPFGAKSIGELVIDTPCPAIANAVYNATGVRVRELPITPEKVAMGILAKEAGEKV